LTILYSYENNNIQSGFTSKILNGLFPLYITDIAPLHGLITLDGVYLEIMPEFSFGELVLHIGCSYIYFVFIQDKKQYLAAAFAAVFGPDPLKGGDGRLATSAKKS
jgi:hypothetical protein